MNASMLEYCKVVLEKVHFDPQLFRKEYHKSLRWLSREERKSLQHWIAQRFTTSAQPFPPQGRTIHATTQPHMS